MLPELIFDEACEAFKNQDYAKAERGFRIVLSQEPAHAPSLYFLGQIALARGAGESAVNLFYEAYTAAPDNQEYIYALAVALQGTGRIEEALTYYKHIEDWSEVQNAMGLIYQQQGRTVKAKHAFEKAIKMQADNAYAWTNLGALLMKAGQDKQAQTCLKKAVRYDKTQANAYMLLAQLMLNKEDTGAAKRYCSQGLTFSPRYAPLWQMSGHIHERKGQNVQALEDFQQAIALDSYNETLLFDKGRILEELGRTDEAEQAYRDCLRLNPSFAPAVNKLAILLHKKGVSVEALELYRQLIRDNPEDAEAILNMATIVADVGDYETAAGLFVLLLSRHVYENEAHQALFALLPVWAEQDKKQAQQYALGWLKNFPDNALAQATHKKLFDKTDSVV